MHLIQGPLRTSVLKGTSKCAEAFHVPQDVSENKPTLRVNRGMTILYENHKVWRVSTYDGFKTRLWILWHSVHQEVESNSLTLEYGLDLRTLCDFWGWVIKDVLDWFSLGFLLFKPSCPGMRKPKWQWRCQYIDVPVLTSSQSPREQTAFEMLPV